MSKESGIIADLGCGVQLHDGVFRWSPKDKDTSEFFTSPPVQTASRKPLIFAIVGKSASGKDYLAKKLSERLSISSIVSWTTRPPREKEVEGIDYHFVSDNEFRAAIRAGEFIEWARFNGWFYGTPHGSIDYGVHVGVFNLDGLEALMKYQDMYSVVPIYMETPWCVRLKRSILREGKLSPEMIRRIFADNKDFANDRYNEIKKLCRTQSLAFDHHFVEKHLDMVIATVYSYKSLLQD